MVILTGPLRAKEMFDRYGVDGIMIGRATVGRPWIFRDIRHYLKTGELLPEPSVNEKADLAIQHLDKSLEYKEGKRAILKCAVIFQITLKGCRILRKHVLSFSRL